MGNATYLDPVQFDLRFASSFAFLPGLQERRTSGGFQAAVFDFSFPASDYCETELGLGRTQRKNKQYELSSVHSKFVSENRHLDTKTVEEKTPNDM